MTVKPRALYDLVIRSKLKKEKERKATKEKAQTGEPKVEDIKATKQKAQPKESKVEEKKATKQKAQPKESKVEDKKATKQKAQPEEPKVEEGTIESVLEQFYLALENHEGGRNWFFTECKKWVKREKERRTLIYVSREVPLTDLITVPFEELMKQEKEYVKGRCTFDK
jgi:hypothetical protein